MKKRISILSMFFLASVFIAVVPDLGCSSSDQLNTNPEITSSPTTNTPGAITILSSRSLTAGFFGSNIENTYSSLGIYNWNDSTATALKQFNFQNLRFPGGTAANYWNWQAGWVYPAFPTGSGPFSDSLTAFVALAKGTTGTPVFVLNVMTYDNAIANGALNNTMIDNQVAMLNAASGLGLKVHYLELGNEFYLRSSPTNAQAENYAKRFSSGTNYATEMNYWIKQLKKVFPTSEIAAVAQVGVGESWNSQVLAQLKGADAVTLHRYEGASSGSPEALLSNAFTNWASIEQNQILPMAQKNLAGWVTEFDFVDQTSDLRLSSTWFHGLYDAEMYIQFLAEKLITQIDIYNFHSDSKKFSLIYNGHETFGAGGVVKPQAGALSATGQVSLLMGQALKGASAASPLSFGNVGTISSDAQGDTFSPYPAVTGVAVTYGASASPGSLILVNLSGQKVSLHYNENGNAQLKSISAPTLLTNIVTPSSITSSTGQISLNQFTLAPYSVNWVFQMTGGAP